MTCLLILLLSLVLLDPAEPAAQRVKSEDLVAAHVQGVLGAPDRAPGARDVRGACRMTTTIMGAGSLDGQFVFASASDASDFTLRFNQPTYEGESFAFDGKGVEIGFAQPRTGNRSALGFFLSTNHVVVREGLFGGVLNARWPLFDLNARQAKLSYEGLKSFDGRELHRLRYRARRGQGDLSILLYFEGETFRHVATVYHASRAQDMGLTIETSSQQQEQHFTLEERFGDYQSQDGLATPRTWVLRYSRTGDSTTEWKYTCSIRSVDPAATPPGR
jgi:hypothetical protein